MNAMVTALLKLIDDGGFSEAGTTSYYIFPIIVHKKWRAKI
jgi:hypothetical protein